MLTWLRELAETVGSFDRSALEPGYALRCTAGVAVPLVIAALLGKPAMGVPAAIGAFICGFTSLQGVYRTRLQAMLIAALGMALASFIGALSAISTPGVIAATAVAAYACATIGQIGPVAATVTLNSFVVFVLFSSQALGAEAALSQSALVLAGGLIQTLLLLASWPTAHLDVERTALADVYDNLAAYARAIAAHHRALPPLTPFATARQIIADPQPFARSAERARFNRLLEDSETIRKRLAAHATTDELPSGVVAELDAIVATLRGSMRENAVTTTEDLGDLGNDLHDARLAAEMISRGRLSHLPLTSRPKPGPYVDSHVDWFGRDSLRFSLVLAVAMVLGRHFSVDRGYWIPMTAAIVLKPDFQTTFVRGVARIGGTLVGAVVATLVLALVRGHAQFEVAGILIATAVAYLTFSPNYALFTIAITSFVVLVLGMRGLPGTTTIDVRVLDTLAGGALAMVGYLLMPTWEHRRTRQLLADLLDAQRVLLVAILRAYGASSDDARARIERARTAVWKARTVAEASIDRTRHEPRRPHSISIERALRILAATQRMGLATLALEGGLDVPLTQEQARTLGTFATAVDGSAAAVAESLRAGRRVAPDDRLTSALSELSAPPLVEDRLRAYVDALSRFSRLVR
ncbi:MAG TPA: FUSC family protein [Candidatus Cybelea sp.]|nr:FUSC family protein [Candidatus Cybelea sp.]